jgi:hypothetical protein
MVTAKQKGLAELKVAAGKRVSVVARAALSKSDAKKALDRATKTINSLQREDRRQQWLIGRALQPVVELSLFRARGYASMGDYIEQVLSISRVTAYQYLRVSEAFGVEMVERFGMEKLDRGLRYIAATPEDEAPKDLPSLLLPTRDETGVPGDRKRFEDMTLPEVRAAVALATEDAPRERVVPLDDDALAESLVSANQALDEQVGRAFAKAAEVVVRKSSEGAVVDVRAIPLARAKAAFAALAKAKWVATKRAKRRPL